MDIDFVLSTSLVIRRADWPQDQTQLDWAVRSGRLVSVLPGVYASPVAADDWRTRVSAVAARFPDAVFTAGTAARLSWWPELRPQTITCSGRCAGAPAWLSMHRRRIGVDQIVDRAGLRYTSPALSALELALDIGPEAVDAALLRRIPLTDLREATQSLQNLAGMADVRRWLHESRDTPWSPAERALHALLREAGLAGWVGNKRVGRWRPDVCFVQQRVIIEVDGWEFHRSREAFELDRERHSDLVAEGWFVLRFSAQQIEQQPRWVIAKIRRALSRAGRLR